MKKELEEIQRRLNDVVAKLNETPKFEVGKWYSSPKRALMCFQGYDGKLPYGFGFYTNGRWGSKFLFVECDDRQLPATLATESEVRNALFYEYERLGFKDGVAFKGVKGADKDTTITIGKDDSTKFLFDEDGPNTGLYCGNSWIFWGGQWATPIKEEPLMIGGREVNFYQKDGIVFIGCNGFKVSHLEEIKHVLQDTAFYRLPSGFELSSKDIDKILDRMK